MDCGIFTRIINQNLYSRLTRSLKNPVICIVIFSFILLAGISADAQADNQAEIEKSPTLRSSTTKPSYSDAINSVSPNAHDDFQCTSKGLPPWPLRPLTQENRKALIKFLVNKARYKVTYHGSQVTQDRCSDFLDAIRNEKAEILSPLSVRATSKKNLNSELAKCTPTTEFKIFSSAKEEASALMSDPAFSILPPAVQAQRADFIFQATANMEYYDLSGTLGKGIWGHLGEGVVRTCLPAQDDFCKRFVGPGYAQYKGTVFNTVDLNTCKANYYTQSLFTQRIIAENEHKYSEVPSVVAFLKIEDGLFFFDANGAVPWQWFDTFANEKNTEITLVPLDAPSAGNQSAKNFCFYKED